MIIENQISTSYPGLAYEWRLEFAEEILTEGEEFVGFDASLTIGTQWGNHAYIDFGSAFLGARETTDKIIPHIANAVDEVQQLIDALNHVKEALLNRHQVLHNESS